MERTSVGNDDVGGHLFRDATEAFEVRGEFLAFLSTEGLSVLQKSIGCPAVQFEQLAHLCVGDLPLAVSLDNEGLKRLARCAVIVWTAAGYAANRSAWQW
jgi:hypothetical protein